MKRTLRTLRRDFELSQSQVAKLIGVSESTWFNWEQQKTFPNVIYIEKIQKVFGVTYDDIIFLNPITVKPSKGKQEV